MLITRIFLVSGSVGYVNLSPLNQKDCCMVFDCVQQQHFEAAVSISFFFPFLYASKFVTKRRNRVVRTNVESCQLFYLSLVVAFHSCVVFVKLPNFVKFPNL